MDSSLTTEEMADYIYNLYSPNELVKGLTANETKQRCLWCAIQQTKQILQKGLYPNINPEYWKSVLSTLKFRKKRIDKIVIQDKFDLPLKINVNQR